jgi:hypothetical protein
MKETAISFDDTNKILTIKTDTRDTVSGMDSFKVFINDILVDTILAKEFADGVHAMKIVAAGDSTVRLVATDRAGNASEFSGNFFATGSSAPRLEEIPSIISANEQLLLRGKTHAPHQEVTVYIKNIGTYGAETVISEEGGILSLSTRSGSDNTFFVLTPKLKAGEHDIWVEAGTGDAKVTSDYTRTRVTSQSFVTIGSFNMNVIPFVSWSVSFIITLLIGAYYAGSRNAEPRSPSKKHVDIAKDSGRRALLALKKRLEKHLDILQETRRSRILTKGEKELKQAMELDLDAVDTALEEHKSE